MRSGKGNSISHEEDEYEDDDYGSKKDGSSMNTSSGHNTRDGKNNDKASAMRSKHSVTEQRRRSKINERFQILRDLIPNSDQKRDTASFLLEVIEYVQYLQEKTQRYEGSYQGWNSEPTKLMPWRNSHWRVQNFVGHPQPQCMKNGPSSGPDMIANAQNPAESDQSMDITGKGVDSFPEVVANKGVLPLPMPLRACIAPARVDAVVSDAQCLSASDTMNQHEDLSIEGGTISFSSAYSQGLLNTLTQALQSAGVDLSQASVSVQIDLGKRVNRGLIPTKDHENPHSVNQASSGEEADRQVHKRVKT